jgi:hypothetical protein
MSLVLPSYFEGPIGTITQVYTDIIMLVKKNKTLSISAAILLLFAYRLNKKMTPPKALRHIPYLSYFTYVDSTIHNHSPIEKAKKYSLPLLNTKANNGLYMVNRLINRRNHIYLSEKKNDQKHSRMGWELHATGPEAIKKVLLNAGEYIKQ